MGSGANEPPCLSAVIFVLTELTDLVYVSPFVFKYEKVLVLVPLPKLPFGVCERNPAEERAFQ